MVILITLSVHDSPSSTSNSEIFFCDFLEIFQAQIFNHTKYSDRLYKLIGVYILELSLSEKDGHSNMNPINAFQCNNLLLRKLNKNSYVFLYFLFCSVSYGHISCVFTLFSSLSSACIQIGLLSSEKMYTHFRNE